MKTLIIIPAYNESENLPKLFDALEKADGDFDIIVINDCSRDDTEAVCKSRNIKVVSLPVNLGIGGAVQTGYRYALYHNYDIAIQIDGDGQHDPNSYPILSSALRKGIIFA